MIVLFSLVMSNFNIMIANNLIRREQNMHLFVEVFKKRISYTIGCKRNNCEIMCFLNPLLDLLNDDCHLDEKKGVFLAHYLQNKKLFDILLKSV